MRILVVNPNSTAAMTDRIAGTARAWAPGGVEVIARTNHAAPPAIQGEADGIAATPGVLEIIAAHGDVDGAIIACFDDTGLAEARAAAPFPVLGVGQAGFHAAALLAGRFACVTTLAPSVPVIEENLVAMGLASISRGVFASGVPVLALEDRPETAAAEVAEAVAAVLAREGAGLPVVLGCAGMAAVLPRLHAALPGARLIEPVGAAIRLMGALAAREAA